MDYYKRKKIANLVLAIIFIIGIILQFIGHNKVGYGGLAIQIISLILLVSVLFIYNKRHK